MVRLCVIQVYCVRCIIARGGGGEVYPALDWLPEPLKEADYSLAAPRRVDDRHALPGNIFMFGSEGDVGE